MEFLIVCEEYGGFDLQFDRLKELLRPATLEFQSVVGHADHAFEVEGCLVETFVEMPGIQVVFADHTEHALAVKITHDILENLVKITGQSGEVLDFSGELESKIIGFE